MAPLPYSSQPASQGIQKIQNTMDVRVFLASRTRMWIFKFRIFAVDIINLFLIYLMSGSWLRLSNTSCVQCLVKTRKDSADAYKYFWKMSWLPRHTVRQQTMTQKYKNKTRRTCTQRPLTKNGTAKCKEMQISGKWHLQTYKYISVYLYLANKITCIV